jgi:hypothetical protein
MSAPAPSAVFEAAVWEAIAVGRAGAIAPVPGLAPAISDKIRCAWELAYNAGYDAGCDAADAATLPVGGDVS